MSTKNRLANFGNRMNNFANVAAESKTDNTLRKINADEIVENKYNSSIFSMDGIESLSESMKESGDLEPIRVWKRNDGKYEIIAGHRRFRAHQLNGDKYIDAIIAEGKSESQVISELILTNVLARRLTPIEDARAMKLYIEKVLPELRENGEASGKSKEILAKLWGISLPASQDVCRFLNSQMSCKDFWRQQTLISWLLFLLLSVALKCRKMPMLKSRNY